MPATAAQRQPAAANATQAPLPLAEVSDLAAKLARRVARNPADFDDLQQLGLFEYHQSLAETTQVSNPFGFARTVLLRAMWRFYGQAEGAEEVSLEDNENIEASFSGIGRFEQELEDRLELDDYLENLEKACGPQARMIAENLLSPSGECAAEIVRIAKQKVAKQQAATAANKKHQPRGVKGEIRLSHPVILEAMGMSHRTWWREVSRIREFTRWYLAACYC